MLIGLVVFGPLTFLASGWAQHAGLMGFAVSWCVSAAMWAIYRIGTGKGRYKHLQARPWKEQVW